MEIRLIWEIIKRRKWVIIQAFLGVFLTTVIGTLTLTPVYESTAKIIIQKSDSESGLLAGIDFSSSAIKSENFFANQLEIAAAGQVSEKVISKLHLTDPKGDLLKPESLMKSGLLASKISPSPKVTLKEISDTDIVEVVAKATDPDEAATLANTFAQTLIEYNIDTKKEKYKAAKLNIEQQLQSVKKQFINILEEIKKFRLDSQILNVGQETDEAIGKLFDLMTNKENNIIQIAETRARITTLRQQLEQQDENKVSSATIKENDYIQQLKLDINELELKLEESRTEKTEAHPDVLVLRQKLKKAKESLKKEIELNNTFSGALQDLERELAALEARRLSLNSTIQQYMADLSDMPAKMAAKAQLDSDLSVKQGLYNNLLELFYQIVVLENAVFPDIGLVASASAPDPDNYDSPSKVLNGIMGIILGLMFGFVLCFLIEYMDDSVKGLDDLKKQGLTVLGAIPKICPKTESILQGRGFKYEVSTLFQNIKNGLSAGGESGNWINAFYWKIKSCVSGKTIQQLDETSPVLLFNRDTQDRLYDFYRVIRNNLKFVPTDRAINSLMVVSSKKGEGRSSIVINIGTIFAREGEKVLIIDTDFQNPSLLKILGVRGAEESSNPGDAIRNIDTVPGLSVLSIAHLYHTSAEIIELDKMNKLISDLKMQYDMLIFDSSPLNTSTNAAFMSKFTDASVLVVESGGISEQQCERVVEYLKRMDVVLAGAIANKFVVRRHGDLL